MTTTSEPQRRSTDTDPTPTEIGMALLGKLNRLEADRRKEKGLLTFAVVVLLIVGLWMVGQQNSSADQRRILLRQGQTLIDCTTPTTDSDCQRRMMAGQAAVLNGLADDNLNASIAVGTCLHQQASDVTGCSRAKFAELRSP